MIVGEREPAFKAKERVLAAQQDTTFVRPERSDSQTTLSGYRLLAARCGWVGVTLLTLALFLAALPAHLAAILNIASQSSPNNPSIDVAGLAQLGFSLRDYAAYDTFWTVVLAAVCTGTAGVLFWRRSADWMALLVSLAVLILGVIASPALADLTLAQPNLYVPVTFVQSLGLILLLWLFYVFPDGRFVPGATRWLVAGWAAYGIGRVISPALNQPFYISTVRTATDLVVMLWFLGWYGTGALTQVYRYRRVSTPLQQQQTKWVVFGIAALFLILTATAGPLLVFPSLRQPTQARLIYQLATLPLAVGALSMLPISISIALLRYRLFAVDLLINRTVVYGLLTALLLLIYISSVVLLQAVFRRLLGQESDAAVVGATLASVALFAPLRNWLQTLIDQRFYRYRYDAAHTLALFSATLRDEVDFPTLAERLTSVVHETMRPAHVSLWLKDRTPTTHQEDAWTDKLSMPQG